MTSVGCVGGLTLDWVRTRDGVTGPSLGGNALYSAAGCWLTGATPSLCAVVGSDFPEEPLSELVHAGVDVEPLVRVDCPSFHVLLDDSGPRRRVSYLASSGKNAQLDPGPEQVRGTWDAAHVAAIPTGSQRSLAARLAALGVPFSLDTIVIPGEIEPEDDDLMAVARQCAAFLPSLEDVNALWPSADPRDELVRLARELPGHVVTTCGAEGSLGSDGERVVHVPAYATTAVDTTGAGDSYCGAFVAVLAQGASLATAMAWGSAAASVVVEQYGVMHAFGSGARERAAERAQHLIERTKGDLVHVTER